MAGDVLSQAEIDALLSAINSGEKKAEDFKENKKKEQLYDFKRALKFSKEQIRTLTKIHENFARLLSNFFSAKLRSYVQIEASSVDQLPYEEFISSIPNLTILNTFTTPPLKGRMVMEIDAGIAYAMLERLLGGNPDSGTEKPVVDLTDIERTLIERTFSQALREFVEVWKNVIPNMELNYEMLETNSQFIQIVSPNETVALISLHTKIGEVTGLMRLCLPHVVLEPIMLKLSGHYLLSTQKQERNPEDAESLERRVKAAPIDIIAELGTTQITVGQFLGLGINDVIELRQDKDKPMNIKINSKNKFLGKPGKSKGKYAMNIVEIIDEGDDDNGEW